MFQINFKLSNCQCRLSMPSFQQIVKKKKKRLQQMLQTFWRVFDPFFWAPCIKGLNVNGYVFRHLHKSKLHEKYFRDKSNFESSKIKLSFPFLTKSAKRSIFENLLKVSIRNCVKVICIMFPISLFLHFLRGILKFNLTFNFNLVLL